MSYDVLVTEEMSISDRDAIVNVLQEYNLSQGYRSGLKPVGILLRDPKTGKTIGGLWGRTSYDWLNVEFLALPETLRDKKLGTELMRRAEEIARERGCVGLWLTTLHFQAPGFYQKLGFEIAGEIEDSPRGGKRYIMSKRLPL